MAENKLNRKQNKLIAAMMSEANLAQAAAVAGCGERSVYRWLNDPTFQEALAQAEAEAISEAARSMAAAARESVDYLRGVLQDDGVLTSEKIRAALGLLAAMPPVRVLGSIERRIQSIKENRT